MSRSLFIELLFYHRIASDITCDMTRRELEGVGEGENPVIPFGIQLSDITDEVLKEIFTIYDATTWAKSMRKMFGHVPTRHLRETLLSEGSSDYRYGSRLSDQSKLLVRGRMVDTIDNRMVTFEFDDNIYPKSDAVKLEVEAIRTEFDKEINRYLSGSGFGVPLR